MSDSITINVLQEAAANITINDTGENIYLNPLTLNQGIINHSVTHQSGGSDELSHNLLGGLNGGQSGQYYHISSGQYFNLTTGDVVRPSQTGNFITTSQTGAFYPRSNPSGFITGVDLSNYVTGSVVRPSETGVFITNSQTGLFYPSSNPSGFITGLDTSVYVTGAVVRPSETGNFITSAQTGVFYASSNPSGFITGVDLSNYVTGNVVRPSETGNFIINSQTGAFYSNSNPSGFITGVDLSNYITGAVVRPSETGNFITVSQTGAFYASSNPSGFITGVDLSNYALKSYVTGISGNLQQQIGYLSNETGSYVLKSATGSFITASQTGQFYAANNPSGFITGVNLSAYATQSYVTGASGTLQSQITNLNNSTGDYALKNQTGSFLTTGAADGRFVALTGDQTIYNTKTFSNDVYINRLYVTGSESIVTTNNFSVQSPYIILNLTGGATDGGIFFVTGSGLTGINDYGPIIGFDHSDKFKFGVSTRASDLSSLPTIGSVEQINALSGYLDPKINTLNSQTGSYALKSETGSFITTGQTGAFYAASNPSGFITGVSNAAYTTGNNNGAAVTIGTNDAYPLNLSTSGVARMTISNSGDVTLSGSLSAINNFTWGKASTVGTYGMVCNQSDGTIRFYRSSDGSNPIEINIPSNYIGVGTIQTSTIRNQNGTVSFQLPTNNIVEQRNALNSQTFNIYNTYTSTGVYERAALKFSGGDFVIGAETLPITGSNRNILFQTSGVTRMSILSSGNVALTESLNLADQKGVTFGGGSLIYSTSNSFAMRAGSANIFYLQGANAADVAFRMTYGGTTTAYPAIKRSGTSLEIKLADDSAYTNLNVGSLSASGTTSNFSANGTVANFTDTASNRSWRFTGGNLLPVSNNVSVFGGTSNRIATAYFTNLDISGDSAYGAATTFTYNAAAVTAHRNALGLGAAQTPTFGGLSSTGDIEITDSTKGIILRAPNGTRWRTTVTNSGALSTVSI
jgi:hypothetical protein